MGVRHMKTLTELSGTLVRTAAKAIAEAQKSLPKEVPPAPAAEPAPEAAPAEAAPAEAAAPEGAEAPAAAAPAKAEAGEETESEAVKAALDAAVAAATGLSGDRLSRLRDAVKAAGRRTDDVRLVRVFGVEEPVPGAKTINGFQFLVDHAPASMKQVATPGGKEKGGRGGRGGGGGRGPGGAGGGGGKGAPTSGGFSMDSLREDRKNDPSRGRGRPGGGRPGGGRPGGAGSR